MAQGLHGIMNSACTGQHNPENHQPVLVDEVLRYLQPDSTGIYVDGTLGLGGHTMAILEQSAPEGQVLGLEWDNQAADIAEKRLAPYKSRVQIIRTSYAELPRAVAQAGYSKIDGLVLDLGVSSLQLDDGDRGFSFRFDAPLDMRMSSGLQTTAADLLRTLDSGELADIFYYYGEERQARRIANTIVQARKKEAIATTGQLAALVAGAIPKRFHPRKIHVATRVFQALRIAVNRELENLTQILECAPALLKTGARFCIITFHSLEDRIVKRAFSEHSGYRIITRQPVVPGGREKISNTRSRSAKLRVAAAV